MTATAPAPPAMAGPGPAAARPARPRHRRRTATRGWGGGPRTTPVAAMERLLAANSAEITRADTKAAVLLGFLGAVLGAFVAATRAGSGDSAPATDPWDPLWWSAVTLTLLAIGCCVGAIAPRHRAGRRNAATGPGYFEHLTEGDDTALRHAFDRAAHDPAAPLLASLRNTSAIIRAKYRWIERGTALLLLSLPLLITGVRPM
ncbi:Pycsar system effector family protein [Streptomyces sp. NPDC000594]|uniref:Pycsar system effector family protein n=1 Tax=Streptomyces sp. NPDC000594 TaxID=3154261 RepID=UPI00332F09C9